MDWFKKAKEIVGHTVPTTSNESGHGSPPMPPREQILRDGAVLSGYSNISYGTYGYLVQQLHLEGLLTEEYQRGVLPDEAKWIYRPVDAGDAKSSTATDTARHDMNTQAQAAITWLRENDTRAGALHAASTIEGLLLELGH